jgi:hypothetical protein
VHVLEVDQVLVAGQAELHGQQQFGAAAVGGPVIAQLGEQPRARSARRNRFHLRGRHDPGLPEQCSLLQLVRELHRRPAVLLRAVERHQPRGLLPGQARSLRRAIVLQAGRDIRGFQWWACLCYVITLALQVPFLDQLFYVGPLVKPLGGADISWIAGFGVASLLYLAGALRFVHVQPGAAAAVGAAS